MECTHWQAWEPEISSFDVKRVLSKAKNNKAPGPGNLRMELLKYGGYNITEYLKNLFNKIEVSGDIPQEWNMSYISSIHKKGDKTLCENYRGISVIPSIVRLFASILKEKIQKGITFRKNKVGLEVGGHV